jgi:trigger factor
LEKTVRSPREWQREVDVTIEADRLKSKLDDFVTEYTDKAAIPGFRVGKVPREIIEKRFGGQLESAVVEELVEDALKEILADDTLAPISQPKLDHLEVAPDKTVKFQVSFEVMPAFELKEYAGLALKKEAPEGFDAEFEKRLKVLREKCATFKPLSRPAQAGDYVVVDYRTFVGEAETGKPRANVMMELGDDLNSKEVNETLVGAKPGEERSAVMSFPPDHEDKELAGKTMTYRFTVRDVKERILPEVTEEFAQDLGFDNLDKLRIEINEEILHERKRLEMNGLKNQAFDFLTAEHQFEPPESWVGASLDRLRSQYNLPEDAATTEKLLPVATKWAKFDCIVAKIADKEKLTVTDEEIREQAEDLAKESKREVADVLPMLETAAYKNQLLREKVLRLIVDKANVT